MKPSLFFTFTKEKAKVVLEDWEETDVQGKNRPLSRGQRSVGVAPLPTPSFQSPFVLSHQCKDRKACADSHPLDSCFLNIATL